MLDGLLNRGFSSKCKSLIKDVIKRLEVVRRRAEAKQRFLKEDLVKLLANGHDTNAYRRTEEFLAGLNLLSCYDFIEYTCQYIAKLLSIMQKQCECPEDCREAVASLMFAAARFSDLPELRDLRDLFQERYGSELKCFVNQKFLEKLSSLNPSAERRIQLLQDLATEFSINWDRRGFEQKLAGSSSYTQVQASINSRSTVDKCSLLEVDGSGVKSKKSESSDVSTKPRHTGHDKVPLKHSGKDCNDLRKEEVHLPYHGRPERKGQEQPSLSTKDKEVAARRMEQVPRRQEAGVDKKESSNYKDDNQSNILRMEEAHLPYHGRPERKGQEQPTLSTKDKVMAARRMEQVPKRQEAGADKKESSNYKDDNNQSKERRCTPPLPWKEDAHLPYHGRPERKGQEQPSLSTKDKEMAARRMEQVSKRQEGGGDKKESSNYKDDNQSNMLKPSCTSGGRWLDAGARPEVQSAGTINFHERERSEASSHWKTGIPPYYKGVIAKEDAFSSQEQIERQKLVSSDTTMQKEESHSLKATNTVLPPPYVKSSHSAIPPPYIKPKDGKQKVASKPEDEVSKFDGNSLNPSPHDKIVLGSANRKQNDLDNEVFMEQKVGLDRANGHENEQFYENEKKPLPRPRSVRRKQHKSSAQYDDINNLEDGALKISSSSRRKESSRKGLQILFDHDTHHNDEEERIMDKLLIHYSKKPSNCEASKMRRQPESHLVHPRAVDIAESSHDGHSGKSEVISPSMRSVSLPNAHDDSIEATKIFPRANSFQPDNRASHVHPKLPEYDALAAQFAALKGQ